MRNKIFLFLLSLFLPLSFAQASNLEVKSGETLSLSGTQNYDNVYIRSGGVLTTPVGSTLELIVSGEVIIESGGKIDVSGKGNAASGKGGNGASSGTGCSGKFGSGGGGGGYGGKGGKGGDDVSKTGGSGGSTYGNASTPSLLLGSPGGVGGGNTQGGGLGGGGIKIKAKRIKIYGEILANGEDGWDDGHGTATTNDDDGTGGGGGGSGGTIWLIAEEKLLIDTGALVQANGGNGGDDINCMGHDGGGGGGGGGRIFLEYYGPNSEIKGTVEAIGGKGKDGGSDGDDGTIYKNPCSGVTCEDKCEGKTAYKNGSCNPSTGKCEYAIVENCDCICVGEGVCIDSMSGGLVPCGRWCDDPTTFIDETEKCTFCHLLILGKRIADFLFKIFISFVVLFLIIAGVLIGANQIELGKTFFKISIVGATIATVSWLVVDLFFAKLTPNTSFTSWNHALCNVAPCIVNGHCETDKGETAQNCPSDCACDLAGTCSPGGSEKKCNFDGDCQPDEQISGGNPQSCPDCAVCGNGVIDVGEECDGASFPQDKFGNPVSCESYGYATGTLSCTSDCKINLSGCHDLP